MIKNYKLAFIGLLVSYSISHAMEKTAVRRSRVAEPKYDYECENNEIEQKMVHEMVNAILKSDKTRIEWLRVNQKEDQFVNAVEKGDIVKAYPLLKHDLFKKFLINTNFDWLSEVLKQIKLSSSVYRCNKNNNKQREKYTDQLSIAYCLVKKELVKVEKKHLDYFNQNVSIDSFDIGRLPVIYYNLTEILKEKASIAKTSQG